MQTGCHFCGRLAQVQNPGVRGEAEAVEVGSDAV